MTRSNGTSYQTYTLNVQLDLSIDKKNPDLLPVKLLFSSSVKQQKENWVVFLSIDEDLSAEKIFEIYSLRWSIEQTGDYAVHYASIHPRAIRYILIAHRMLESGESFGAIRNKISRA